MSLKDLLPQPVEVPVGDKKLVMHPLTLEDIIKLCHSHLPEVSRLMDGATMNTGDVISLVKSSPKFVGTVIAYSSGNPDEVEDAMKLPFSVQLLALEGAWRASMIEEESVKKFVVRLSLALRGLNEHLKKEGLKLQAGAQRPEETGS